MLGRQGGGNFLQIAAHVPHHGIELGQGDLHGFGWSPMAFAINSFQLLVLKSP